MWRLFLAAIGFVGDNPLYELGRKRRLPWWQARPAFAGLVSFWYGTLFVWAGERLSSGPDWMGIVFAVLLWVPFLILPVLGATLAAAAARRDCDAGLWEELMLTRLSPEQVLAARAVVPLRLAGSLLIGLGAGWIARGMVEFLIITPSLAGRRESWQVLGAFALAATAGLIALGVVVLDALRQGMRRSRKAAAAGATLSSLALQAGFAALIVLVLVAVYPRTAGEHVYDSLGAWVLFWLLDALLNALAVHTVWRRAVHALRWPAE